MNTATNLSTIRKDKDRATGIVLLQDKVLLMFRRNRGKEYYTFPGGGIEARESREDALKRELLEEASVEITPMKLLYTIRWEGESTESVYLCEYTSGTVRLSEGSVERSVMREDPGQHYEPMWVALDSVPGLLVYPLEVRDMFLLDRAKNFAAGDRELVLDRRTSRQV